MTTQDQHRTRVIHVMAEILEVDPTVIRGEQRLREDLGMDSLGSLELLSVISQELDLELEMENALAITTVDDACAFVARHYAEQHGAAHARA
ncbi:MAG TPA: acyl carrier protein [Polyangiales bacterium]|jgi:acyl carrier protein